MQLKGFLFLILIPILVTGCGSDSARNTHGISTMAASQGCMDLSCHGTIVSPGTGAVIAQEWLASTHNTQNGAGCADCHEPDAGDPHLCSKCHGGVGFAVTRNPDRAGNCGNCHGPSFPDDLMMALAPQHYGYSTATLLPQKARASYVSAQYQGRCRACHNPHDNNLTQNHRDYARSLHGDPTGVAWTYYDFKQDNRAACARCHTSTGYISFVTNGFTPPTQGFSTDSTTREVLACDACHASYDFKNSIRQVPAFTATYKNFDGSTQASYPDVGATNLCIPCHSGRDSAQALEAVANFSNAGFINSHYLAAAGLMYMQTGFTGFTAPGTIIGSTTYGRTLSPDHLSTPGGIVGGTSSTHRKFGTPLINGRNGNYINPGFFVTGVMDQNGPCVTCHMNASGLPTRSGSGHSLKIDANAYRQVCVNCHTSENGVQLTADNFHGKFLEPQGDAFRSALKLLEHQLARHGVSFNKSAYPYFFDDNLAPVNGNKQALKDWTRGGTMDGRKFMGACFNMNLLSRDPAAFAHAYSYSRRLIYDSIDFLDDGAINLSVGATALSSGLTLANGSAAFAKDAQAYNIIGGTINTTFGATSQAMLYLTGWNRSTGAWSDPERP